MVDFRFDQGECLIDACIPDTVSHRLVFPAKLSDWFVFASIRVSFIDASNPDTVGHWLVFPAKLSDWLIFAVIFDSRRHPRHGQSLAAFPRQAF